MQYFGKYKNMNDSPLIELENISFSYPKREVLKDINLRLFKEDRIGIAAPNGAGKTTLLYIIMGLLKRSSGKLKILGKSIEKEKDFFFVRKKIGLLFQDADDQLFCPTVIEDVAFGPLNMGKSKKEAIDIAMHTLSFLGIEKLKERATFRLSGGEKKIASLAAVLAMQPEILLLDEPINGLDEKTKNKTIEILNEINLPFILISHDPGFISAVAKTLCTIKDGKIERDIRIHTHPHIHSDGNHTHPH